MHKLTEEYKAALNGYENFRVKIEVLIKELLIQNNINFHKVESRVKDPLRLEEKIARKNDKYTLLNDITDLVGIRVITYFEDEVDKVAKIIQEEFTLDKENSIDKRELEADRFGYKSLHSIVFLKPERRKLTEYKRFKDYCFEVQIRSVLQHAWAEIEHDIGYKSEISIPVIVKRNFYRVAALLEMADIEFVNIKKSLAQYEATVQDDIKNHPEQVELNTTSLSSFISNDPTIEKLDKEIVNSNYLNLKDSPIDPSSLIEKLRFLRIETIGELESALKTRHKKITSFAKAWMGNAKGARVGRGISIFYLCYVLVAEKNDLEIARTYYAEVLHKGAKDSKFKNKGNSILTIYKKMNSG
jgi:putative GTP pyrophosphokinase